MIQVFEPELTELQTQVLKLLGIPTTAYTTATAHAEIAQPQADTR